MDRFILGIVLIAFPITIHSLLSKNPASNQTVRKNTKIDFLNCQIQLQQDSFLISGEGQKKSLRIYSKEGDSFFLVLRELSRKIDDSEISFIFPKFSENKEKMKRFFLFSEIHEMDGNSLIKILFLNKSKTILISVYIRSSDEVLKKFFLSEDWISSCR
jgi:hypothetical protein